MPPASPAVLAVSAVGIRRISGLSREEAGSLVGEDGRRGQTEPAILRSFRGTLAERSWTDLPGDVRALWVRRA